MEEENTPTKTFIRVQVRANFSGPKGSLGNNLQSSVGVKRLTKAERAEVPEQGAIGRRASTKRRALIFASEADLALSTGEEVTNADPEPKPLLKTRDACTQNCMQTEPPFVNTEEKSSSVDASNFLAFEIFTIV